MDPADQRYEDLKAKWIDKLVAVKAEHPELKRFEDVIGRVITVNRNNKAVIDFGDGAWYDITASEQYLTIVEDNDENRKKYDAKMNSAQLIPDKQK